MYCNVPITQYNTKRHLQVCKRRQDLTEDAVSVEEEEKQKEPVRLEVIPALPPTGEIRSSRRAPDEDEFNEALHEFVVWMHCPTALGRTRRLTNPKQQLDKFRTVIGRMSKFYDIALRDLMVWLSSKRRCLALFESTQFPVFLQTLSKTDKDRKLSARTSYNYCAALKHFLEWRYHACNNKELKETRKSLALLLQKLGYDKKHEVNREEKAARIESLPTFRSFFASSKKICIQRWLQRETTSKVSLRPLLSMRCTFECATSSCLCSCSSFHPNASRFLSVRLSTTSSESLDTLRLC